MKRLLSILLLLSTWSAFGAAGDVKWATVETNGWVLKVDVDTIGTNGGFNFGFTTNTVGTNSFINLSASKVVLRLTSQGYDATGSQITNTRTIYGTKQLRQPYPYDASIDITNNGSDAVIRLALSEFVYAADSNLTVSIAANWYSNNNAVANLSVTNLSTNLWQKCVANWTWPGASLVTNTMRLNMVGFHSSGQQGLPLRMVTFIARDQHSHATTNIVTSMSVDWTKPDAAHFGEYIADMDISAFTSKDDVRCDFIAYPWSGDTNSVINTVLDNYVAPWPASITNVCNNDGSYGVAYAVVDATNGVSSGVVTTNFNSVSPPTPFATINQAESAIAASNSIWFSRSDTSGSITYLTNGSHTYMSTTGPGSVGSLQKVWPTITRYPTSLQTNVIISAASGDYFENNILKIKEVNFITDSSFVFNNEARLWFDHCYFNCGSTVIVRDVGDFMFTDCVFSNFNQGFTPIGTVGTMSLFRGNVVDNFAANTVARTVVGNIKTNSNTSGGSAFYADTISSGLPYDFTIIYNNSILGYSNASPQLLQAWYGPSLTNGAAIVQNTFEENLYPSGGGSPMIGVAADGSTSAQVMNLIYWNNTHISGRQNFGYQDNNSAFLDRKFWSVKNNNWDGVAIKTDTFNGTGGPNGNRTGNWPLVYGVGWSGNVPVGMGAQSNFPQEFSGLNSTVSDSLVVTNWYHYTLFAGYNRTTTTSGTGNGNYRLLSESPVFFPPCDWVIPFDLEGNYRSNIDPPGAYAAGNYKKGAGFFQ